MGEKNQLGLKVRAAPEQPGGWPLLDGCHFTSAQMEPMSGAFFALELQIRQGVEPGVAAALLRRVADVMESKGRRLLSIPCDFKGGACLGAGGSLYWVDDQQPGQEWKEECVIFEGSDPGHPMR
jgi:hypothetical protein